jgi:hypothetical protein
MDEARFGQQGTMTKVWASKGSRPTAVKQTKYEWIYFYGAIEPSTGESTALFAPHVNIGAMNVFLEMLSTNVTQSGTEADVAVVIMDRAGWHVSPQLDVPDNIRILLLPSYSPELNPVENLWHWIKSHHTSNRAFVDYDDLLDGVGAAWRTLTKKRIRSVCRCDYLTPGKWT